MTQSSLPAESAPSIEPSPLADGGVAAVRVLLIEDDEDDYLITRDLLLDHAHVNFEVEWCADYDAALVAIREQRHDVYLLDYRLGERTGLQLMRESFAVRPWAPVIMLTGQATQELDLEATALGVTDFLVKQRLEANTLERSIRYAISHQQAERHAQAARAANDGIWDWNLVTDQIYLSPRWHAILGQQEAAREVGITALTGLVSPDDVVRLRTAIDAHLAGQTTHLECELRMRHTDGDWRWVVIRGLATRGVDGAPVRMGGSLSDMTDQRAAQQRLEHDALHDTLTGLPNRALFLDRVEHVVQRSERDAGLHCGVLFLDLDGFKQINDSLSHAVGDQLLAAVAGRIKASVRPGDTIARLGGDEFTILLDGISGMHEAIEVSDRILHSLTSAFVIDETELFVSASIGIALGAPGSDSADLIRNADIAMYDAKRRGRACSSVFDDDMELRLEARRSRQDDVREVVAQGLIGIHYQPIVDLHDGSLRGLEALARWPDDRPTIIAPTELVSIAEEIGLIGAVGRQVMAGGLRMLAQWRSEGALDEAVCISINLSQRELDDPAFASDVAGAIRLSGLPTEVLKLEITETTMSGLERSHQLVEETGELGVELYLDDFGTGHTSLMTLHLLPVAALKIDSSFVTGLLDAESKGLSEAVIRSAVALAHSRRVPVIAKGIENSDQLRRLRELGCDLGQGAHISPALRERDLRASRVLRTAAA